MMTLKATSTTPTPTRATIGTEFAAGSDAEPSLPGPRRTCVGCRSTRAASELVRVVRDPEGKLQLGRTLPGRGAWLCRESLEQCSDEAIRKGGFSRAFRNTVSAESLRALRLQIHAITR